MYKIESNYVYNNEKFKIIRISIYSLFFMIEQILMCLAQRLSENYQVSFDVGDALNMRYSDGSFELIFVIQCIEHIQDKEKVNFHSKNFKFISFTNIYNYLIFFSFLIVYSRDSSSGCSRCSNSYHINCVQKPFSL